MVLGAVPFIVLLLFFVLAIGLQAVK